MATALDRLTVEALYKRGLAEGGRRQTLARLEWDVCGNCLEPITRFVDAHPVGSRKGRHVVIDSKRTAVPLQIDLDVRCRKCRNCLRYRKSVWTARAIEEYRMAVRTWLGTFTLRPEEHDMVLNLCRKESSDRNEDFDVLTSELQFVRRHMKISKWLTLYLKRVRKNSGAKLRYLLVCEAHKSGLPHYHALIHETELERPVTKRCLELCWPHGFTNFHLLPQDEVRGATYACKYLNKSVLARVRASQRYGASLETVPLQNEREEMTPKNQTLV